MQEATFPDWTMGFATVYRHVMAAIPGFADLFALDHQLRAEHADKSLVGHSCLSRWALANLRRSLNADSQDVDVRRAPSSDTREGFRRSRRAPLLSPRWRAVRQTEGARESR